MSRYTFSNMCVMCVRIVVGGLFGSLLCASFAFAESSRAPICNALVSLNSNLYLVDDSGGVITQFTADGTPKVAVTLAPDGRKVAYVTPDMTAHSYEVVNAYRPIGTYPIYNLPKRDDPYGLVAQSTFESLSWESDDVLSMINSAGKNHQYFFFRHIPASLRPFAPLLAKPAMADNCTLEPRGRGIACIGADGSVFIGGGTVDGQDVFALSGLEGIKPEESFSLGVGESVNTQGTMPIYNVTLLGINKDQITLKITPPGGNWSESIIRNGGGMGSPGPYDAPIYGFFATITNPKADMVRIDVVKSDSPASIFDPALAWSPDGRGLLFIRRTNTQASLYLIYPGRRDHRRGDSGHSRGEWDLVAQAVINAPQEIVSMRFATPSLLLLKDRQGNFSEVPIEIGHRRGRATLTLGTVTALPSTLTVQLNGTATQGSVLGWSCENRHEHGHGGR